MKELSRIELADPITQVVYLFRVYQKNSPTIETFDKFYGWGEMLINDFDDIDNIWLMQDNCFKI